MITAQFYSPLILIVLLTACGGNEGEINDLQNLAGNQEVANYMKSFEGRGALTDNSTPTLPEAALEGFRLPEDLAMDLVLAEPMVHQPLEIVVRELLGRYFSQPAPSASSLASDLDVATDTARALLETSAR